MSTQSKQSGATLVVSLIMLVILTLLVISAIRFGNTNLKIAGNMQVQAEISAAGQQAIEQVISDPVVDFTSLSASKTITVNAGAVAYQVTVAKPNCENTVPLMSDDPQLKPQSNADDALCVAGLDTDVPFGPDGKPIPMATKCNQQQWHVQADVIDPQSGAKITIHQGIAKRTYIPTPC
jgi:hypothetical protein